MPLKARCANKEWLDSMEFDTKTLRLIVQTIELGSITAAASACRLALSAASKRISDVEVELGVSLFDRTTRGARATEQGLLFAKAAKSVLQALGHLDASIAETQRGVRGLVRIAANASAIAEFLPRLLKTFLRDHPDIRVQLNEMPSVMAIHQIHTLQADVAVVERPYVHAGLRAVDLASDHLGVVTHKVHPIATDPTFRSEMMFDFEHVALEEGTALCQRIERYSQSLSRPWLVRVRVGSFDAACRMVAEGIGIAVLPREAIDPQRAALGLKWRALHGEWARRTHCAAISEHQPVSGAARALMQHFEQGVPHRLTS
jgi:DNA-binding transcriptional LysR family regulator